QVRPVTAYAWHRQLTSANIDEILPKQGSRLIEWAQRAATHSLVAQHAAWDPAVLRDNEPFTTLYKDASYVNSDAFLFCLNRWGLPSQLYAHMLGGSAPKFGFNIFRFIQHVPMFIRMVFTSRRQLETLYPDLLRFEKELDRIEKEPTHVQQQLLLNWFLRLYVFVVKANLVVNSAIASSFGRGFTSKARYYQQDANRPHRVPHETDPASPRPDAHCPAIEKPPTAPAITHWLLELGSPGTQAYLFNIREWLRDNYTRLYFRLHHSLARFEKQKPYWFDKHPHPRTLQGAFWQDVGIASPQDHSTIIYPGDVQGRIDHDILIVDSLDPGQLHRYKTFKAVIARTGGSLSHGAILLRENAIPSAIIPDAPALPANAAAHLHLNQLTWQPSTHVG
ncbi:MAG: PEP-utilizing enzyme, partial [Gammaproteobacteria bacterium]